MTAAAALGAGSLPVGAAEMPLTPEAIVAKKFEGKATVEFLVGPEGTGVILGGSHKYGGAVGLRACLSFA